MKEMHKKLFVAAALTSGMFAGTSAVHADPANATNGYTSVHDNITDPDKGANFGRCNAVGGLAAKVCTAQGTLAPPIELVIDACNAVGVDLADDPEVAACMEDSCEDLETC
jgi:hypothetical protein